MPVTPPTVDIGAVETAGTGGSGSTNSIVVTTTSDAVSHTGTSLRDAIAQANTDAGNGQSDTITFSPSLNGQTITLCEGYLKLYSNGSAGDGTITIDGNNQITIDGNNTSVIMYVVNPAILEGLTFEDALNGAVIGEATATLLNCNLLANSTTGGGSAIQNSGAMTVVNCTLSGNSAGGSQGGTIYSTGSLTLVNTTISGNTGSPGGVEEYVGNMTIVNSTIANNVSAGEAEARPAPLPSCRSPIRSSSTMVPAISPASPPRAIP